MSYAVKAVNTAVGNALSSINPPPSGGVWNSLAPDGQTEPYIIFQYIDDIPSRGIRGSQVVSGFTYLVKAVSDTPGPTEADEMASQIDAALSDVLLSISGYGFVKSLRSGGFRSPLPDGGWQSGGYYIITLTG